MVRILVNGEWFDAVSSEGQYETEFENIIVSRADILFPDYYLVPFKVTVESEHGSRRPDLALIDRRYRHWWVVEVEMAHHSLNGHVMPQIEVFAQGYYGTEHVEYMASHSNSLDPALLADMVKGAQPRVLVIVNQNTPSWFESIHRLGGLLTIVEIFRSENNRHILRLNGDHPMGEAVELISYCRLDLRLPRFLQIDSPAALGITHGEQLSIGFGDGITDWERLDTADQVWLNPVTRNPLSANQDYQILKDESGRFFFQKS